MREKDGRETKNTHSPEYLTAASVHLSTYRTTQNTHTNTHWCRTEPVSVRMYFRESARGQILHLHCGWQQGPCWRSFSFPEMPSTQKHSYVTDMKEGPLKAQMHSWHSNKPKETFSYQLVSCICCYQIWQQQSNKVVVLRWKLCRQTPSGRPASMAVDNGTSIRVFVLQTEMFSLQLRPLQ